MEVRDKVQLGLDEFERMVGRIGETQEARLAGVLAAEKMVGAAAEVGQG